MNRVFVTGDFHGGYDADKFSNNNFKAQKYLDKSDIMIICGDFGICWDGGEADEYWEKWLTDKPWTTLAVPGNHENYEMIKKLPTVEKFGAKCWKLNDSLFIAQRGEIATIYDHSYFLFGGARSHDKGWRTEGESWWKDEEPTQEEMDYGLQQLNKYRAEHFVCPEYFITHDCSATIHKFVSRDFTDLDPYPLTEYFEKLDQTYNFCHWFFGHHHLDANIDTKHTVLYNDIIELTPQMHRYFQMADYSAHFNQVIMQKRMSELR